jgi:hypothetical protein
VTEASFDREILDLLHETGEVHIETRREEGAPEHRTVIWVVVVDGGVFVRSVRGEKGRWYREASSNPEVALRVGGRRVPVRAVSEMDAETIEKVNEAYREKYEASYPGPTAGIVREEVLPTTLRLLPA